MSGGEQALPLVVIGVAAGLMALYAFVEWVREREDEASVLAARREDARRLVWLEAHIEEYGFLDQEILQQSPRKDCGAEQAR